MSPPTALVLRALYLGDVLTGLPALRLLRDSLPNYRIVLAAPPVYGDLARQAELVDRVLPTRELDQLRVPEPPDIAVDLHGNGTASRELLRTTRPRQLVAYSGGRHIWSAAEHEVARWCRLVDEAFGAPPPWPSVRGLLPVPTSAGPRGVTVVHPGAKAAARRWPAVRYVDVARRLAAQGHRVVVTGGPGEGALARSVAKDADAVAIVDSSLSDLLALVAHARLVVCGDTGIAHVASTYGTPSVVLFGPVSPAQWGPPADGPHRPLWHGTGAGDPHGNHVDPALLAISVDEVVAAASEVNGFVQTR